MLTLLRKKAKEYAGRHADDHRAPTGTRCEYCGGTEPGTGDQPVTLVRCSVCQTWLCSQVCFSIHRAPAGWGEEDGKAPWWRRWLRRG